MRKPKPSHLYRGWAPTPPQQPLSRSQFGNSFSFSSRSIVKIPIPQIFRENASRPRGTEGFIKNSVQADVCSQTSASWPNGTVGRGKKSLASEKPCSRGFHIIAIIYLSAYVSGCSITPLCIRSPYLGWTYLILCVWLWNRAFGGDGANCARGRIRKMWHIRTITFLVQWISLVLGTRRRYFYEVIFISNLPDPKFIESYNTIQSQFPVP